MVGGINVGQPNDPEYSGRGNDMASFSVGILP